jgi:hypothetical protein
MYLVLARFDKSFKLFTHIKIETVDHLLNLMKMLVLQVKYSVNFRLMKMWATSLISCSLFVAKDYFA